MPEIFNSKKLWSSPVDYSFCFNGNKISLEKIEEFLRKIAAVKTTKLPVKQTSIYKKTDGKPEKRFLQRA
jgi:hypothetical protein